LSPEEAPCRCYVGTMVYGTVVGNVIIPSESLINEMVTNKKDEGN
jgi:hypothetical protein